MTTSGTYGFNPSLGEIVLYAYNNIGIRPTAVLQEHMESARMASNMMLSRFSNQGVNLWAVDLVTVPLVAGQATYAVDGNTIKAKPTMGGLVLGYEFHPNFALEGAVATNMDADTISLNGADVAGTSLKVNRAHGLFLKPKAMLAPNLELFGRLGWVENKTTGQVNGYSLTDTDDDFAYGLGINYHFNKTTYGSLGYTSFYDKHNTRTRGATLAVGMKF